MCRARATSSLPQPLSPSTSTGNGAAAARSTACRTSAMTPLTPRIWSGRRAAARAGHDTLASDGAAAAAAIVKTVEAFAASTAEPAGQRATIAPMVRPP